jgi:hypothetical protein
MSGRKNKAVPVNPLGIGWINLKVMSEKYRTDLSSPERES